MIQLTAEPLSVPITYMYNQSIKTGIVQGTQITDNLKLAIDKKQVTCGLFVDTVNHGILLSRLFLCGICGPPHSCFERYLTYRTQYVKTECIKFGYENIACGIPQGSTLLLLYVMIYQIALTNSQCHSQY